MTAKVEQAIEKSAAQDRIVRLDDISSADLDALKTAAQNWSENQGEIEFWGRDDDGDAWRVHVPDKEEDEFDFYATEEFPEARQ